MMSELADAWKQKELALLEPSAQFREDIRRFQEEIDRSTAFLFDSVRPAAIIDRVRHTQTRPADDITRDPFDALICAAAQTIELPLVTRDTDIRGSGAVRVIW